jgi:hypothetical protein
MNEESRMTGAALAKVQVTVFGHSLKENCSPGG